ncbi:Serine/threonine-protein kinase pkn6 [Enhygromyxa salina]|uniref:Serine/threonine-protein kinase pkn6 n=1 Tax=Enhygromyxa salina TaxID=215803 RepID=A0A2S9YI21_9BACT|nr:serine/threonine-protein kinase [Enhygromyxa salina]PRQ04692.1 Serine/threonine-protein kinase pkn6 [Enhygromyxa salina]
MRHLGQYQLLRKIGSGGMAEVWSARIQGTQPSEDRFFAIKLLASHLSEREEYREMFLAEARLSMMLGHPNIVQVYDAVAHDHDCYMVMELVSGMTLSQFQRALAREHERLPLTIAAFIIGELLRSLSYAHQVRTDAGSVIVHRDVSPQNVMVTTTGEVKLMDFGIARFATEETQGSFVKGKLQYMPPEQLRKQTRKPTVDLYAVGAILHELIDGRRFRGKLDQGKLLSMVMSGEVPPLRDPSAIPPALDQVRKGLLEPDEAARIPTARKALGMLVRWPEYRESNSDLRRLVLRFVEPDSVFEIPEGSKVSSVPEGSWGGIPDCSDSMQYGETYPRPSTDSQLDVMAAAQTVPTGSELTAEEDPELLSASEVLPVQRARRKGWPFALAGVGVAAALGVGFMVLGVGKRGSEPEPEGAAVGSEQPPGDAAARAAGPEQPPEQPPEQEGDAGEPPESAGQVVDEAAAETGGELATETGDEAAAETGEEGADAERELVPIEFVANEFFFVYVRVNGRVLTLEPRARIQLPEGSYGVQLRQSPDEKWQRAGRIKIESDAVYRVEMRKPNDLKLVKK